MGLLLKKTDQNIYGPGAVYADIAEYLTKTNDVFILNKLVNKAIELKYDNFNQFQNCIQHLHYFQDELIKYAASLSHSN